MTNLKKTCAAAVATVLFTLGGAGPVSAGPPDDVPTAAELGADIDQLERNKVGIEGRLDAAKRSLSAAELAVRYATDTQDADLLSTARQAVSDAREEVEYQQAELDDVCEEIALLEEHQASSRQFAEDDAFLGRLETEIAGADTLIDDLVAFITFQEALRSIVHPWLVPIGGPR